MHAMCMLSIDTAAAVPHSCSRPARALSHMHSPLCPTAHPSIHSPTHAPTPQVGEHAECGPGNLPSSGFTYRPEYFMEEGIGFVNLSWRDMGVPTLDKMMDIVQVPRRGAGYAWMGRF